MRKRLCHLCLITALLLAVACQSPTKGTDEAAYETTELAYADSTAHVDVSITADYPTAGPGFLCDSVAHFIDNTLGGEHAAAADGQQMLDYYGKAMLEQMQKMYDDFNVNSEDDGMEVGMFSHTSIKLAENEAKYLTYVIENEAYEGGAHGYTICYGVTINKLTGIIERQLLKNTSSEAFRQLLVAGLMHYFSQFSPNPLTEEEQLADELLIDDMKELSLPGQNMPYLTKAGIVITYSPYEIAPYAAGIPTFTIPFSEARPFMTKAAEQLITENEKDT